MVKTAYFSETLEIPEGVAVEIKGNNLITVKGPNGGPITKNFSHARGIKISIEKKKIHIQFTFSKNKYSRISKNDN